MVTLTDRARASLAAHARARGAAGFGLKIFVVAGGCAGFSYDLHWVEGPAQGDARFGDEALPIFVDRASLRFLEGTVIDYQADGPARGFSFHNPRATAQCSCGASFAL